MLGIYFSGNGNTEFAVKYFVKLFGYKNQAISIENRNVTKLLAANDTIVLGYPIYYSNLPKIMEVFLKEHSELFKGKQVFIIVTMGLFSGDGTGCAARMLKKYGATILGGTQLKMPDCIGDVKLLKKSHQQNKLLIQKATRNFESVAKEAQTNHFSQTGLSLYSHFLGLFGQRLWFLNKTKHFQNKPDINLAKCKQCQKCIAVCPMKNLVMGQNGIEHKKQCTLCYRCVNTCPNQAITIIGKTVHEQCYFQKYQK